MLRLTFSLYSTRTFSYAKRMNEKKEEREKNNIQTRDDKLIVALRDFISVSAQQARAAHI